MSDFLDHLKSMPRLDAFACNHPPSLLGYRLVLTCRACPEQYDMTLYGIDDAAGGMPDPNPTVVGYLRLRHGHFRAEAPDCGGETLYEASTNGDVMFDDDERLRHLTIAVMCIDSWRAERRLILPPACSETDAAHRISTAVARIVEQERANGASLSAILAGLQIAIRTATSSVDGEVAPDDVPDAP